MNSGAFTTGTNRAPAGARLGVYGLDAVALSTSRSCCGTWCLPCSYDYGYYCPFRHATCENGADATNRVFYCLDMNA